MLLWALHAEENKSNELFSRSHGLNIFDEYNRTMHLKKNVNIRAELREERALESPKREQYLTIVVTILHYTKFAK